MATITSPQASYSTLPRNQNAIKDHRQITTRKFNRNSRIEFHVLAEAGGANKKKERARPGVDTRIHWENPDEGWIGGSSNTSKKQENVEDDEKKNVFTQNFADLLYDASGTHYEFLGVPVNADIEEIKAAYRKLSKEYHPDTTTLPLKSASEKFMRLREVYNVLSDEEKRKFYDWTLAQEEVSRRAEEMRVKLEDPFEQDFQNYKPVPDMVDRLGGKNMQLSDQAMSALTIDAVIVVIAICCIIYVVLFKEPYYY